MLRRAFLLLMLLAGLAAAPLARAGQPCCEHGCDAAMPACISVCALCASPAALPVTEPLPVATTPQRLGLVIEVFSFDDWTAEIWNPPD
jgi:hypothetical protein